MKCVCPSCGEVIFFDNVDNAALVVCQSCRGVFDKRYLKSYWKPRPFSYRDFGGRVF